MRKTKEEMLRTPINFIQKKCGLNSYGAWAKFTIFMVLMQRAFQAQKFSNSSRLPNHT
jgi:hypothetical protein